jgi:hypothetical protein
MLDLTSGRIIQYAYTVPDMDEAIAHYVEVLKVGPWFRWGPFKPAAARYRGESTSLEITLARAFRGDTMIELIQQHDDGPSVYREVIEERGHGFHHFAVGVEDHAGEVRRFVERGFPVVFADVVPSGAHVTYVDTRAALPGMLEVLEINDDQKRKFQAFKDAADDWNGSDPIRQG